MVERERNGRRRGRGRGREKEEEEGTARTVAEGTSEDLVTSNGHG